MDNETEIDLITRWINHRLPFAVFREPGKEGKVAVQHTPLETDVEFDPTQKGFHMAPFLQKSSAPHIFIRPDSFFSWDQRNEHAGQIPEIINPDKHTQSRPPYQVTREDYMNDLELYFNAFSEKGIRKAIYSRVRHEELPASFNPEAFFNRLCEQYPKAFVYMVNVPGDGLWVGASPELLISCDKGQARTVALAGTLKVNKNIPAPEWTRKEIDEHRLVEQHIIATCEEMNIPFRKSPVRSVSTGKVYHLKSEFKFDLDSTQVSTFIENIHPTPAISGLPKQSAIELIEEVERHDRRYYCGFLGWIENAEDFNMYINLRCMQKKGKDGYLFAGGGITPDSDPEKEWLETEMKMATIKDLLPGNLSFSLP